MKKKELGRWVARLMLLVMVATTMSGIRPRAVSAANNISSQYLNNISKYLYLDGDKKVQYDFNILSSALEKGATYTWYVKQDKGNPESVSIDRKTGVVTAKEAGTAYIRCKITLQNKTIIRPEAKVIVRNDITQVEIKNIPANSTIAAGREYNFNRTILNTKAGIEEKTKGITRWEIKDDTAGVKSADDRGKVFPVREGEFRIRAISFSGSREYNLWLRDKSRNEEYITAASRWHSIKVNTSDQTAIANNQEQLNKALAQETLKDITLSTTKAGVFVIEKGIYLDKTLNINTPNADVNNYGVFKEIHITALKDDTWIEYADGNVIYLTDEQLRFVVAEDARIKRIVVDQQNAVMNFDINGTVEEIVVIQKADLVITGSSKEVLMLMDEQASSSKVTISVPIKLKTKASFSLILNKGSEGSQIDKSANSLEVTVDNRLTTMVVVTTNQAYPEYFEAGKIGVSDATTAPTLSGGSNIWPDRPSTITGLSIEPKSLVMSVTGSAMSVLKAVVIPEKVWDKSICWESMDEEVVRVNQEGALTPVGIGSTTVIASAGGLHASANIHVVSGAAIIIIDEEIEEENLKSIGSAIAMELAKGAASYVGGELMGWALAETGLFEDATQSQINEMKQTLKQMSLQLDQLDNELRDIGNRLEHQIIYSEYNTRASLMADLISDIFSLKRDLVNFAENPPTDKEDLEKLRNQIKDNIKNKLLGKEYLISNILAGTGTEEPLLKTWSKVVKGNHRFLSNQDSLDVLAMYEYYETIQTWLLELQVEYYHLEYKKAENQINSLIETYYANLQKQKDILEQKKAIPEGILIDKEQNLMIYNGQLRLVMRIGSKPIFFETKRTLNSPTYEKFSTHSDILLYSIFSKDIRVINYNEVKSWIDAGKGQLLSYLQASGWNIPLDSTRKMCVVDGGEGWNFGGINIKSGKTENIIMYNPVINKFVDVLNGGVDPLNYSFYYIHVRSMADSELNSYFY